MTQMDLQHPYAEAGKREPPRNASQYGLDLHSPWVLLSLSPELASIHIACLQESPAVHMGALDPRCTTSHGWRRGR